MLSFNPILVLLAVALAMYLLTRLTRSIDSSESHPKELQDRDSSSASTEPAGVTHASQMSEDPHVDPARSTEEILPTPSEQGIEIDADRETEIRGIEPDLAAALDQAEAEIRLAEDQTVNGSVTSNSDMGSNYPINNGAAVLEPRENQPVGTIKNATYGPGVSISDAVLVEPIPKSSLLPSPKAKNSDSLKKESVNTELDIQPDTIKMETQKNNLIETNDREAESSSKPMRAKLTTAQVVPATSARTISIDTAAEAPSNSLTESSTADSPETYIARSDITSLQVESNSAQLMLIDSFTDILIGTENLSQSMQRITHQAGVNRLARSKLNAEQQRKLILANARAEKQRSDIDSEKKARVAGESLIGKQQSEIERNGAQMDNMKQTILLKQTEIEKQQLQLTKSKSMARSAAKLARRAAITQQQAKEIAETEKKLRHKVEGRTQQAISIAKNAITALAEEEKKNRADSISN